MDTDSKVAFNDTVYDVTSGAGERGNELAVLRISGNGVRSSVDVPEVKELAGVFYNISGATVDPRGRVLFVDAHTQRIYRWTPERRHRWSCFGIRPLPR